MHTTQVEEVVRAREGGECVLSSLVGAFGVPCGERPRLLPRSRAYPGRRLPVGAISADSCTGPGDTRGGDGRSHHPLDVALCNCGGPDLDARR
jgi:hypothetical protein